MELYKFCSVIGERNHRKREKERERAWVRQKGFSIQNRYSGNTELIFRSEVDRLRAVLGTTRFVAGL